MQLYINNRASNILYLFLKNLNKKNISFIIPGNICPIVPAIFIKAKVKFEFIDIDLKTFEINLEILKDKINSKKNYGILWLSGYGRCKNNNHIFKFIKEVNPDNVIIDDRCLSIPKIISKNKFVDLILYSTGYSKFVDLGYGGYAYSKIPIRTINANYDISNLNDLLKNFNYSILKNKKIDNKIIKTNWINLENNINEYNYFKQIRDILPKIKKHKKKINNIYFKNLPNDILIKEEYNNWRFNIMVKNKQKLLNKIFSNNLFASSHYYPSNELFDSINLPNVKVVYESIINLFNDFRFNEDKAYMISNIINNHHKEYGSEIK